MKKALYILSFLLLFFGCQDIKRPEKPKNLISEATMVDVLVEVYLGNAARSVDNVAMRNKGVKIDSFLFKKYNIDSLQFAKSNAYYASDLNTYNAIFQQIKLKLEALKTEENNRKLLLDSLKLEKRKTKDSINIKALKTPENDANDTKPGGTLIDPVSSEQ